MAGWITDEKIQSLQLGAKVQDLTIEVGRRAQDIVSMQHIQTLMDSDDGVPVGAASPRPSPRGLGSGLAPQSPRGRAGTRQQRLRPAEYAGLRRRIVAHVVVHVEETLRSKPSFVVTWLTAASCAGKKVLHYSGRMVNPWYGHDEWLFGRAISLAVSRLIFAKCALAHTPRLLFSPAVDHFTAALPADTLSAAQRKAMPRLLRIRQTPINHAEDQAKQLIEARRIETAGRVAIAAFAAARVSGGRAPDKDARVAANQAWEATVAGLRKFVGSDGPPWRGVDRLYNHGLAALVWRRAERLLRAVADDSDAKCNRGVRVRSPVPLNTGYLTCPCGEPGCSRPVCATRNIWRGELQECMLGLRGGADLTECICISASSRNTVCVCKLQQPAHWQAKRPPTSPLEHAKLQQMWARAPWLQFADGSSPKAMPSPPLLPFAAVKAAQSLVGVGTPSPLPSTLVERGSPQRPSHQVHKLRSPTRSEAGAQWLGSPRGPLANPILRGSKKEAEEKVRNMLQRCSARARARLLVAAGWEPPEPSERVGVTTGASNVAGA
eukprot:SAG11_NODE_2450_length_3347_cov_1.933190_2_plen_550_part_00